MILSIGKTSARRRRRPRALIWLSVAVLAGLAAPAAARERLDGPIAARVIEVIDGDTLAIEARIWLGQGVRVKVRVEGVDTPEKRSRCVAEKTAAAAAKDFLAGLIGDGDVRLFDVRYGKFAGRVLARVQSSDGTDVAAALIAQGHARTYDGGRRRPWCDDQGRLVAH